MKSTKSTTPEHRGEGDNRGRPSASAARDRIISSAQNPKVKAVLRLRQRSHRDEEGLMIIEGSKELRLAMKNGIWPAVLFHCAEFSRAAEDVDIITQCRQQGIEIFSCAGPVFRKMSYRNQPQGPIAVAPQPRRALRELMLSGKELVVVAESIEKPGNLGAILRSADAAGASAVIVCDRRTDVYNPNVLRASIGTLFSVPVIEAASKEALAWLRRNNMRILAATPHADTKYTDADMRGGLAVVVGEEHGGLSDIWLRHAEEHVRIPMRGQADSLNVAATATILLFEAVRQRDEWRTSNYGKIRTR